MWCSERCSNLGLELVVVFFTVFMTVGFLITYIIAVQQGHVTPDLPYISDTGGKVPESCVFTFVCSIGAMFTLVIIYIRYKHLCHYYHFTLRRMPCLNVTSLGLGLVSVLGLLLVGSFQNDSVPVVHFIGAFFTFWFGMAYAWLQTFISYRIWKANLAGYVSCFIIFFRLSLCIVGTFTIITAIVVARFASEYHVTSKNTSGSFIWQPGDGGFALHVVSTAAEWVAGLSFVSFFLSFHPDFQRICVDVQVKLKHHHGDVIQGSSILDSSETTPLNI